MKAINALTLAGALLGLAAVPALADLYINVVAVNGADAPKNYAIKFGLPGELTAEDILDTNGLQLDYNVDDGDYFVFGDVSLKPKESKTFRVHIKDKWMVTQAKIDGLKQQITQGYDTLGKPYDAQKAEVLKARLDAKLDYIFSLQGSSAESIDKRIDDYRQYTKEMKRIENQAMDRDYWRSDPADDHSPRLVRLNIEVHNPTKALKHFKHKDYLPAETKPEDVYEAEDFEVRFDQVKQLAFLFKEEDLVPGETKKYSVGILDIWTIDQRLLNNLRTRAQYVYDYLKATRFAKDVQVLMDRVTQHLQAIEDSQAVNRPILEHISVYRVNKPVYEDTVKDVEDLEKLLAVFRENLEKSKVENILQKIQSLKNVGDISKAIFNKNFETSSAWSFIGWILLFVGGVTLVGYIVSLFRSKEKNIKEEVKPKG